MDHLIYMYWIGKKKGASPKNLLLTKRHLHQTIEKDMDFFVTSIVDYSFAFVSIGLWIGAIAAIFLLIGWMKNI